jgi:hypothetical protein
MKIRFIGMMVAGILCTPLASIADTPVPGRYAPHAYYGGGNNGDFFEDGSFYGDSRGNGRARSRGEAGFSMSISGKARGEQTRDGSFGSSGYGGSDNYRQYRYPAPYPYMAPHPYYVVPPAPVSPSS